jgi:hypothetical protein
MSDLQSEWPDHYRQAISEKSPVHLAGQIAAAAEVVFLPWKNYASVQTNRSSARQ